MTGLEAVPANAQEIRVVLAAVGSCTTRQHCKPACNPLQVLFSAVRGGDVLGDVVATSRGAAPAIRRLKRLERKFEDNQGTGRAGSESSLLDHFRRTPLH